MKKWPRPTFNPRLRTPLDSKDVLHNALLFVADGQIFRRESRFNEYIFKILLAAVHQVPVTHPFHEIDGGIAVFVIEIRKRKHASRPKQLPEIFDQTHGHPAVKIIEKT